MLPGKALKPEDILGILRRRIWLLLVPFAVVAAGTAVVARKLPPRYQSDTLILVVPQRVPESYVKSTVTTRIEDRLQSMMQQILSRTRLERIIQDFNLYADERRRGIMEDVVEGMRKDINVEIIKGDAFRLTYTGDDPSTVMRVTERLASLFIEENLRDRTVLADGTDQFLESQLEAARVRLAEKETELKNYQLRYSGQLPKELETNLQVVQNTQLQIQALVDSINRDGDRRLILERQIADLESFEEPEPQSQAGSEAVTPAQQLAVAKANLAALQLRLKPEHPDLQRAMRTVRDLEAAVERDAAQTADVPVSPTSPASLAAQNRARRLGELKLELDLLKRQVATKQADEQRLRGVVAAYQSRAEAAPAREAELQGLTRDYDTLRELYSSLLAKREESKMAAELERRQIGEQFKVLDPARMPQKPTSPDRLMINLIGLGAGFAVGLGLIALMELKDKSFKTDEDVLSVLQLPVLAVIPRMQSTVEKQNLRRRRWLVNAGLGSSVAACAAIIIYAFVTIR